MKKSKLLKVVSINLVFIALSIVSVELLLRIKLHAKIDTTKPFLSFRSIGSALLNRGGEWDAHLNQSNVHRKPYPYLMFKGAPNHADHNSLGYRISDPVTINTFNIAFFGGSTGYGGNPAIINILTQKLNALKGDSQYSPLNFSVVSSNHNQHIHSLIENYTKYPLDIIIFYGGYNETLQTAFYDPRPGFPYNYRARNEMSPEEMLLSKHFALYKLKERYFENPPIKPFTSKWSKAIVDNYIQTIDTTRLLTKSLATGRCKTPFLFIYQPYQMSERFGVPNSFKHQVHQKLKSYAVSSIDGIDVSDLFRGDPKEYTDIVHLTQSGNAVVATKIFESSVFKDAIKSCRK
ncbi:MAG: hypothetical protein FJ333_10860 [Sphingomonadales bacterium]|nr:hypothetical protein [Sphingomonadales bacterium]